MKKGLTILAIAMLSSMGAQAADVVCSCDGQAQECSEVRINFVPSNPGVYMTVEYAYGKKNLEGFAAVTRDQVNNKTTYRLGKFTLVEDSTGFSMPLHATSKCL